MDNIQQLQQQFATLQGWEERYRLLIQLGKKLPQPNAEQWQAMPIIHGCEVEVRFSANKQADGRYQFTAYSEARIMNGLLYLLLYALQDLPLTQLHDFNVTALLQACGIAQRLSETRLNGLKQIESVLHHLA